MARDYEVKEEEEEEEKEESVVILYVFKRGNKEYVALKFIVMPARPSYKRVLEEVK
jgi:hypothetical protein